MLAKRLIRLKSQKANENLIRIKEKFGLSLGNQSRSVDPNDILPTRLLIPNFGEHLTMFGLHKRGRKPVKYRRFWYRPTTILFVLVFQLVRNAFWAATLSTADKDLMIWTGDFYGLIDDRRGSRPFMHLSVFAMTTFALYSLVTNWSKGPFQWYDLGKVLCGLAPPVSCKLDRNELDFWRKFVGHIRVVFAYTTFISETSLPNGIVTFTAIAYLYTDFNDFLIYGIAAAVLTSFWTDYVIQIHIWELSYFYIGCFYLKSRFDAALLGFRSICRDFEDGQKGRSLQFFNKHVKELHSAQKNLLDCNFQLGHFLPVAMMTLMISFLSWFYNILFLEHSALTISIFVIGAYLSVTVLAGFMLSPAMVTKATNRGYSTLLRLQKHCTRLRHKRRLLAAIESMAVKKNRIGFRCYTWFLITRRRFIDICFILGAFFLKVLVSIMEGSFI